MEELFVTVAQTGPDAFAFRGLAPVRRRRHRPGISAEADVECAATEFLPHEPSEVQLTALTHLRRTSVAQVRVVRPDDDFGAAAVEIIDDLLERLEHVRIAQVP